MNKFSLESDIIEIVQRIKEPAADFSGKTVLLTGARGFLGRYFIEVFRKLNENFLDFPARIIALDNFITSGKAGSQLVDKANIKFIEHDVIKPFQLNDHVHYIIHLAGIASPHYYKNYPLETLDVSITGTKNMLQVARQHQARFTFFSSSEVYGDPDIENIPTSEMYRGNVSTQGPRACYDEGKRVGETLCYIFHKYFGVATNIVRPFNFFGPGMQETDFRVLPNFASRIQSGKPLTCYGQGNQTRTFCYITDAMTGLFKAILKGISGEIYNIGNPKPEISVIELVDLIAKVLGHDVPHKVIDYPDSYPSDEPNRRCPNIQKAQSQLGYDPKVSLEEGLRRFLHWTSQTYTGVQ